MDEETAQKEVDSEEYKDIRENLELKAIIAGTKAKKVTVKFNDVDINVRAAIPKGLREKMVGIAKAYKNEDVETGDEEMYEVLAQICLDAPYNKPAAWKYVDEETGEAPTVLMLILEKIMKTEEVAARFRR